MKSPTEVGERLARQWENNELRERRLLDPGEWPMELALGRPSASAVTRSWAAVRRHLDAWRHLQLGDVEWEPVGYRGAAQPIDVPVRWTLRNPTEWVAAMDDPVVTDEYERLSRLVAVAHPRYHPLVVRRRSLVLRPEPGDVEAALTVADTLTPGCAKGAPLRALPIAGVDTKFYERNRALLVALLDVRFGGAVSEQGLEAFLGAAGSDGHWLLVADLDGSLLPYRRARVTDLELSRNGAPGSKLIVIENEQCLHALPRAADTVAILGPGLNLAWLATPALADHAVAYWGDLDTWGLSMLARARAARPDLTPLLMDAATFADHADRAVEEPDACREPEGLTDAEHALFSTLSAAHRGRLEQEFLPVELVHAAVETWLRLTDDDRAGLQARSG